MPRKPRLCPPGIAQHIIQRGVNCTPCFLSENDFAAYAHWLKEGSKKYGVAIHAWVFMTNHVHLLATPENEGSVSLMMQYIGRHYVRHFNFKHKRTGTLWEGRFRSALVDSERYVLACYRYIEMNPVRAKMVKDPADYKWSSYHANALGLKSTLATLHPAYEMLGNTMLERIERYRQVFENPRNESMADEIRQATKRGILGGETFRAEMEMLTGCDFLQRKRGPKPGV